MQSIKKINKFKNNINFYMKKGEKIENGRTGEMRVVVYRNLQE